MTDKTILENEIRKVTPFSDKELTEYILTHKRANEIITSVFALLPINSLNRNLINPNNWMI